ncbi:MAG: hypothetical protein ACI4RT_01760 [Candidatus Spyradenecus sp.]
MSEEATEQPPVENAKEHAFREHICAAMDEIGDELKALLERLTNKHGVAVAYCVTVCAHDEEAGMVSNSSITGNSIPDCMGAYVKALVWASRDVLKGAYNGIVKGTNLVGDYAKGYEKSQAMKKGIMKLLNKAKKEFDNE